MALVILWLGYLMLASFIPGPADTLYGLVSASTLKLMAVYALVYDAVNLHRKVR